MNPFGDEPEASADRITWCVPAANYVPPQDIVLQTVLITAVPAAALLAVQRGGNAANWISALLVVAAAHALWRIGNSYRLRSVHPNLALNQAGLHWLDAAENTCTISAGDVRGFFVGLDPETNRRRPALTLILKNGSLSQPIELHAPAEETNIAPFLADRWKIIPFQKLPAPNRYSLRLNVSFSETEPRWFFEGPRRAVRELAAALAEIADRYEEPSAGIRPRTAVLACEWASPVIAVFGECFLREETLFASRKLLAKTASELLRLADLGSEEFELSLPLDANENLVWMFQIIADDATSQRHE